MRHSNEELRQTGETFTKIQSTLERSGRENGAVIFVLNEWNGLSTNTHALRSSFEDYSEVDAKIRFSVENPLASREAELKSAIDPLTEKTSMELLQDSYLCHAKLLWIELRLYMRKRTSEVVRELHEPSYERNVPPRESTHACDHAMRNLALASNSSTTPVKSIYEYASVTCAI